MKNFIISPFDLVCVLLIRHTNNCPTSGQKIKKEKKMKRYEIAEDGKGYSVNNLQTEINIGLKKGYSGFNQEKEEVLFFLTNLYRSQLSAGKKFIPFVVTDSVITYAYPKWDEPGVIVAEHEPALVLKSDKSPLFAADISDEEWMNLVEWFATQLGSKFQQFRVYISYTRAEVKILQQIKEE